MLKISLKNLSATEGCWKGSSRHEIGSISERLSFPWIWKSILYCMSGISRKRRFWETWEIFRISNYTQTHQIAILSNCSKRQLCITQLFRFFHRKIDISIVLYHNELISNSNYGKIQKKKRLHSNQLENGRNWWSNTRNKSSWITRSAKRAARYSIDIRSLSPSQAINRRSEEERTREEEGGRGGRKFFLWNVEMISRCRSRATDGGCVLKMKLLLGGERLFEGWKGKENRKVVLRLSAWCVPRPRTHFRFNDRRREEARMFRSGSASNFITGLVKTSWTRGRKLCNANEVFVKC